MNEPISGFKTRKACEQSVFAWISRHPNYKFKAVKYVPAPTKKPKAKAKKGTR